jgi:FkbM family methyltransferase
LKKLLKSLSQSYGFDIVTYRPFLELLLDWNIEYVLDVGANEGQFATKLRQIGFQGHIFSFEPVPKTFARLDQNASQDSLWHTYNFALGTKSEKMAIQVTDDTQLVSIMDPVREHKFTHTVTIQIQRLTDWQPPIPINWEKTCLKIDTQGYEMQVLLGAGQLLQKLHAIIAELAINLSYKGQPHAEEIIAFLRQRHFELWTTRRGTWTPHGFQEIERDGLFKNKIYKF